MGAHVDPMLASASAYSLLERRYVIEFIAIKASFQEVVHVAIGNFVVINCVTLLHRVLDDKI
jgi:hypothetical protein